MSLRTLFASAAMATVIVVNAQAYVPGRVLVKFTGGNARISSDIASLGARVTSTIPQLGVSVVALPRSMSVESGLAAFKGMAGIEYAEPDYLYYADQVTPNDTHWGVQWPLTKINAPMAWTLNQGSSTVKVAVLDTGIDQDHPDLAGKVANSATFVGGTVEDGNGHGSHTAGTVGAITNNARGVASLGWNTRLMIGKVLSDSGSGSLSGIASGITWATDNGAKVINMSLGGTTGSTTLSNACSYAASNNVVICASAGNAGTTKANYPAYYSVCIAVASTTETDARSSFSTYGSWVDIAAPGSNVASTYMNGGYVYLSGTSMASPHVAALAGLLWNSPHGTSATNIRNRMINTGVTVTSGFRSYPLKRINAYAAVQ